MDVAYTADRHRRSTDSRETSHGGVAQIFGAGTRPVMIAAAGETTEGGYLELFNAEGNRVLTTAADGDGGGRLDVADEKGAVVFSIDTIPDVGAALALMSTTGQKQFLLGTGPLGALMNLMNSAGETVIIAGTADEGGGGALSVKNGRGSQVLHAGYDTRGDGLITVWDNSGSRYQSVSPRK